MENRSSHCIVGRLQMENKKVVQRNFIVEEFKTDGIQLVSFLIALRKGTFHWPEVNTKPISQGQCSIAMRQPQQTREVESNNFTRLMPLNYSFGGLSMVMLRQAQWERKRELHVVAQRGCFKESTAVVGVDRLQPHACQ